MVTMFHDHTVVLLFLLSQVWIVPVNAAVAGNEEPVRVSDTHQIPSNNNTLTAKIHVYTDNRIHRL